MTGSASTASTPLDARQEKLTIDSHPDLGVVIKQLLNHLTLMEASQRLHHLRQLQRLVDSQVEEAANEARSAGATWQEIGHSLGITRQAAQSRWGIRNNQGDAPSSTSKRATSEKSNDAPKTFERVTVSLPGVRGSLKFVVARQRITPTNR